MIKILFCLFLSLFLTVPSLGAVDPKIEWKTVQSEHFNLIYDAKQQELAAYYLVRMERAWAHLGTLWQSRPERLTVILNDRTDLTNGYATALPYAHVMLFPALPGPMESISEMGDWAENISIHEFTHIHSMEQRRGAVKFLSHIFGTIITPNILLPKWWLEGVAVDAETRFSNQGRLRSNFQDATLRALASSPRWEEFDLGEINEFDIPTWPYGARPYLFGSVLWSEMIALEGEKMVNDLHVAYGGRLPYMLSSPVQDRFQGQNLTDLFRQAKQSVQTRVHKQKEQLSQVALTESQKFNDPDFVEMFTPRLSPDGLKMAFLAKTDVLKRSIQVYVRPNVTDAFTAEHRVRTFGQRKEEVTTPGGDVKFPRLNHDDAPPGGTISRVSWRPDSKLFVFDLITEKDIFHDVSDLWTYSLSDGKGKQLTRGLRAREPDFAPDASRIAFVRLEAGRTMLAVYDLASGKAQELFRPELMARVAWPVCLGPQRILFSLRDQTSEKLMIYDFASKKAEPAAWTVSESTLPLVRGDQVYFVSNQNGVRNVYRTDLALKNPVPVTHLWTGAYAAEFDPHRRELWVTQIADRGFEVVQVPEKNFVAAGAALPRVQPLLADRYPVKALSPLAPTAGLLDKAEDYRAGSYLWPQYWLPFIYFDDKGTQISASTSGFDPLGKHTYALFGSYDSATQQGSYALGYANQSFRPTLVFQTSKLSSYLADPDQKTTAIGTQVAAVYQLASIDPDLSIAGGWSWLSREQFQIKTYQTGPSLGLTYTNLSQSGEQISPESGGTVSLLTTHFLKADDREHYTMTSLTGAKYGKIPWGRHHAWMARVSGQYVDREISISNYDSTVSSLAALPIGSQAYLMRGYVTGAFLGKSIANGSLEYRFPVMRLDRGPDRFAFYIHRISGAVVADVIGLEGYQYDVTRDPSVYRRVTAWRGFGSAGGEAKFDVTLGYHFSMQWIVGVYAPFGSEYAKTDPRLGLAIGL